MPNRRGPLSWAAVLFLAGVWGSSFAFTKVAVETLSPLWVAAGRIGIGALAVGLVGLAALGGKRLAAIPRPQWLWFLWFGVIGYVLPFLLIAWGMRHVPSSVAGILMGALPLAVLVLAHATLPDERMTPRTAAGFLIGFAGVVVLVGSPSAMPLTGPATLGQLALLGAVACYALLGVSPRWASGLAPLETSVGSLICAALVALPVAAALAPEGFAGADRRALLAVVVLGLFPTGLATFVMYWLIARAGARFTAGCNYLAPAVSALLGVSLLSETLGAGGWIGLALILAGLFVSEGRAPARSGRRARLRGRDRPPAAPPPGAAPPPRPGSPRSRR